MAGCRCFHGRKELLGRLPCSREELAAAFPRSASSRGSPPSLGKHAAGGEGARAGAASSRAIQLSGQQAGELSTHHVSESASRAHQSVSRGSPVHFTSLSLSLSSLLLPLSLSTLLPISCDSSPSPKIWQFHAVECIDRSWRGEEHAQGESVPITSMDLLMYFCCSHVKRTDFFRYFFPMVI